MSKETEHFRIGHVMLRQGPRIRVILCLMARTRDSFISIRMLDRNHLPLPHSATPLVLTSHESHTTPSLEPTHTFSSPLYFSIFLTPLYSTHFHMSSPSLTSLSFFFFLKNPPPPKFSPLPHPDPFPI